jgi:UDP-GlcNAc:undecaprenyl-phosphate GlcNAc-1-phosphate transferase
MTPIGLFVAAVVTILALQYLRPVALKLDLVDHPDSERKVHAGSVPLIGGIAMYLGFTMGFALMNTGAANTFFWGILLAFSVIVLLGVLDDLKSLSVRIRLFFQSIAVLIVCYSAGVQLENIGDLIGLGNIGLGFLAIPFTIFAVIGIINAYNMVDGIDGLAGSLAIVTFTGIAILTLIAEQKMLGVDIAFLFIALLIPFLIKNLNLWSCPSSKVFMGDAGSMFLGFAISVMLIHLSQGEQKAFSPVTALWLTAVPLLDTIAIIIRRVVKKQSPFKPDREHLHHLFMRAGYSRFETLLIIVVFAVLCAAIGIAGELLKIADWIMFAGFLVVFAGYFYFIIKHPWKTSIFIKKH